MQNMSLHNDHFPNKLFYQDLEDNQYHQMSIYIKKFFLKVNLKKLIRIFKILLFVMILKYF